MARSLSGICSVAACIVGLCASDAVAQPSGERAIDFSRDIRPLLADRCFACHGFDEQARAAGLRLDTREGAISTEHGEPAIVPGQPGRSPLLHRIRSEDPDERMPPAEAHRQPLSPEQIELMERWIAEGAVWGEHWSFVAPRKPPLAGPGHPVDYFVEGKLSELAQQGLALPVAPPAEPHTLARRLSFDLIGLPPSATQLSRLMSQPNEHGWHALIDELLASPHFGERLAMWWLDGARYSDTDGFQQDASRENWPWRDWVVDAFNANMPFDQFTIEQFAGDLLPNATAAQQLATCFHRNHMHNGEGGRDPNESRVDYVLDRVNTAGTLWLGLTLGCTQCHDHKFDPISQRDYYSLSAYFNSIDETGQAGAKAGPFLSWQAETARRDVDRTKLLYQQVELQVAQAREGARERFPQWLARQVQEARTGPAAWRAVPIVKLATTEGYHLRSQDGHIITSGPSSLPQDDYVITCGPPETQRITAIRLDVLPDAAHTDGKLSYSPSGEFILTNFKLRLRRRGSAQYRDIEIARAIADVDGKGQDAKYAGVVETLDDDPRTGWTTRNHPADQPHWAKFELAEPLRMQPDEELDIILMQRSIENRELIGRFTLSYTDQRGAGVRQRQELGLTRLQAALQQQADLSVSGLPDALRDELFEEFLEDDPQTVLLTERLGLVRKQLQQAEAAAGQLQVTVLRELSEPRATHVLVRGVWDNPGEAVRPGVLPAVLKVEPELVPTRLELGEWFVSDDNPLTARVIVNQIWQLLFGAGLVRTANDFGYQGELPSHPELLDWLAVDFMESGWDLKHLLKTIVTSATYRRASHATAVQLELDPHNRWLARGARFRFPAWMIRDARLAISEQLERSLGGPPIFPYQPTGVWSDQFMGRIKYQPTLGPTQYRRTLYTFWRRSSSPAFLFDAPQRRVCEVLPLRTNTPLQALNLLNDLTGLEVARCLADEFFEMREDDQTSPSRAASLMFQRVLSRAPNARELQVLTRQLALSQTHFGADLVAAESLLGVGQLPPPGRDDLPRRAALMVLASTLLNLDESITHE